MGSAPASGAVRRALAPNTSRRGQTNIFSRSPREKENDEGVVGSTRGACAPQNEFAKQINGSNRANSKRRNANRALAVAIVLATVETAAHRDGWRRYFDCALPCGAARGFCRAL